MSAVRKFEDDDFLIEKDNAEGMTMSGVTNDNYAQVYREKAEKKKKRQSRNFDVLLTIAGLCLAGSSAFLPWYVFLNQEEFEVQRLAYTQQSSGSGSWSGRMVVNEKPAAFDGNGSTDRGLINLTPDMLSTASIDPQSAPPPSASEPDPSPETTGTIEQEFPGGRVYRLVHVANQRALIEDSSGMYVVRVGSVLPDNSTLSALEETPTGWIAITSEGDMLKIEPSKSTQ